MMHLLVAEERIQGNQAAANASSLVETGIHNA